MKLSEIINAIANNEVIDDRQNPENVDVFLMIQDATDMKHVQVMGYINGDDDRLAKMVADRMVKDDDFSDMILEASRYFFVFSDFKIKKSSKGEFRRKIRLNNLLINS